MRVEGVVKWFYRPFEETDALPHVIFLFEMEHHRLRLQKTLQKQKLTQSCV